MSSTVVAVDPGLRELGVAVFSGRELVRAFLARNPERALRGPPAWERMADVVVQALGEGPKKLEGPPGALVVEIPQVYREARAPSVDPDDLMQLTGVGGVLLGRLRPLRSAGYLPRQWKGQVRKEAHNRQTLAALAPEEVARIEECPASYRHNVLDAVGLGLFEVRRAGPLLARAGATVGPHR